MMLKKCVILMLFIIFISPRSETINKIVARINNDIITDFDVRLVILFDSEKQLKYEDVLQKLIEEQLILASARLREYEIVDQEIDYHVDQTIANHRAQFRNEDEFLDALKKEGFTMGSLKENIRKQIKNQFLKESIIDDKIRKRISVSTSEVEDYYKNNKEEFLLSPKRFQIDAIYIPAVNNDLMAKKYNDIVRGRDIKDGVTKREFKSLYIEYLIPEHQKLFEKRQNFTPYIFTDQGLQFYKIEKWDEKQPHVILYTINYISDEKGFKNAERNANELIDKYKKGSEFGSLRTDANDIEGIYKKEELPLSRIRQHHKEYFEKVTIGDILKLRSDNGYYIILIDGVKDADHAEIGISFTKIYNAIFSEKFQMHYKDFIEESQVNNYIRIY